jgi:hypothetical protein
MHDVSVVVHVRLPGVEVTTYVTPTDDVIAGQVTVTDLLPTTDIDDAGTSGAPSASPVAAVAVPVPFVLVPTTDTVYCVPLIRPAIVHDVMTVSVDVHVPAPGVAVAVYVMPAPSPSACTHDTSSAFFCVAATSVVTAPGGPTGVIASAVEGVPAPTPLVAATEIEYAVLFTSPVIVHVVPDGTEHVFPPGVAVAVYAVTADPFPAATSSQVTTELLLATVAVTLFGAHGTDAGASTANNRFGVLTAPTRDTSVAVGV